METERGSYPSDKAGTQATTTEQPGAGAMGKAVETGFERAGVLVKDAVEKTRGKVAEYRDKGLEQVSQEVAEYTRRQPVPALLVAAGVGMVLGMLVRLGRR